MANDSSVKYKGYASPTLHLVLLIFAVGTGLLVHGNIGEATWSTAVLGMMTTYITATSISKGAEAYMASRTNPPVTTVQP